MNKTELFLIVVVIVLCSFSLLMLTRLIEGLVVGGAIGAAVGYAAGRLKPARGS